MTVRLQRMFQKYDDENPHIYEAFRRFALQAIGYGRKYYGAKSIMERVRWNTMEEGNDDFKINNNYTAYYARKFENEFPQHKGFFRKRKV